MNDLVYLSHNKFSRFFIKIAYAFASLPKKIASFFKNVPSYTVAILKKIGRYFSIVYYALRYGGWVTRLSFLIFGFGNLKNKQWLRGFALLMTEIAFIFFMVFFGAGYLADLSSLGTVESTMSETGFTIMGDNSFNILLYGVLTILVIIFVAYIYLVNLHQAYNIQFMTQVNKKLVSGREDLKGLGNQYYHMTLLSLPFLLLLIFTVIPLIFMIFVAFTNFDTLHQPPNKLFTWVGLENFQVMLFGDGLGGYNDTFAYTFWKILGWTLLWAVLATVTNFVFGMILAIIINKKSIKLKKVWRTFFAISIAVPQFVSLLIMSKMLATDTGIINQILNYFGISSIRFLQNASIAKVTVVVVNMWIGIPYTILSCTGILLNIPEDLYEAARIDGANPYRMYMNITLPYVLFVLGPSLISTFVGNINNFNVIYLLTGGGPTNDTNMQATAGQTDLLITWLYKLTVNDQNYAMASVIGILVFVVCAFFSLIAFSRISSVKNEEDFQ